MVINELPTEIISAIKEKMSILKDFWIVSPVNYDEYEQYLVDQVNENRFTNYDIILDRICKDLIRKKLQGGEG